MTNNKPSVEKIPDVDYKQYWDNPKNVSHAVDGLTPMREIYNEEAAVTEYVSLSDWQDKLDKEIRNSKRVMAKMARRVKELEELKEQ